MFTLMPNVQCATVWNSSMVCKHTACLSLKNWVHRDEDLHDGNQLDLQKKLGVDGTDDKIERRRLEDAHFSWGIKHFNT